MSHSHSFSAPCRSLKQCCVRVFSVHWLSERTRLKPCRAALRGTAICPPCCGSPCVGRFPRFSVHQKNVVTKSASLLVAGTVRIVASRLWTTACTHKPQCVHVSTVFCTQSKRHTTSRYRISFECNLDHVCVISGHALHAQRCGCATHTTAELRLSARQSDHCRCRGCCLLPRASRDMLRCQWWRWCGANLCTILDMSTDHIYPSFPTPWCLAETSPLPFTRLQTR